MLLPVPRCSYFSMRYCRPAKSLFRWSLAKARRAVFACMAGGVSHTVMHEEGDVLLGGFSAEAES